MAAALSGSKRRGTGLELSRWAAAPPRREVPTLLASYAEMPWLGTIVDTVGDAFAAEDVLTVEARRLFGENDLGSFACTITRGGLTLVTGTLTVYQGPLPEEMVT